MSWILYTITATILQNFRNLEQKNLNKKLDALTVSWSRFILPLPFAILTAIYTFSILTNQFILYCIITAIFQVGGNLFLLRTIKSKNFSIGVAFSKTETLQAMIVGFLFFGETVSSVGCSAILVATIGVILMSGLSFNGGFKKFTKSLNNKSTLFGILCGSCFSVSAFNLKFASETLLPLGYSNLKASMVVLLWVICFQNLLFILVKLYQKRLRQDLSSLILLENKTAFFKTSILSFLGSVFWFTAYSLGKVVYVKAVGQIELILAIASSHFILKERLNRLEIIGIILTFSGILTLILFH